MRDFLQILKVQILEMKFEVAVPRRGRSENDLGSNERVLHPPAGNLPHPSSGTRFALQDTPFRASVYSKTHFMRDFSQTVKVEATFLRDFSQTVTVEHVKTKLSCKVQKRFFCCEISLL